MLEARGFTKQDFARSHPGGSLGRQLLLHVERSMRTGDALPRVGPQTPLGEGLLEMSRKGLGMTVVVVDDNSAFSACSPTAICAARSISTSTCTARR